MIWTFCRSLGFNIKDLLGVSFPVDDYDWLTLALEPRFSECICVDKR